MIFWNLTHPEKLEVDRFFFARALFLNMSSNGYGKSANFCRLPGASLLANAISTKLKCDHSFVHTQYPQSRILTIFRF